MPTLYSPCMSGETQLWNIRQAVTEPGEGFEAKGRLRTEVLPYAGDAALHSSSNSCSRSGFIPARHS